MDRDAFNLIWLDNHSTFLKDGNCILVFLSAKKMVSLLSFSIQIKMSKDIVYMFLWLSQFFIYVLGSKDSSTS